MQWATPSPRELSTRATLSASRAMRSACPMRAELETQHGMRHDGLAVTRLRSAQPLLGLARATAIHQHPRAREAEIGVGGDDRFGQVVEPAVDGRELAAVERRPPLLGNQPRRSPRRRLPTAHGGSRRRSRHGSRASPRHGDAGLAPPPGRSARAPAAAARRKRWWYRYHSRRPSSGTRKRLARSIGEQAPACVVGAEQVIAERRREPLEDRRAQQERARVGLEVVEHLAAEVVDDVAIVAGKAPR